MEISTKLKIELPYHPEIPPLGIYQKELTSGYFAEITCIPNVLYSIIYNSQDMEAN